METNVKDTVREENDAKTRLMNAKAKAAAQKGINKTVPTLKNINTGKEISTNVTKEAPKVDKTKKEPKVTIASKFDEILTKGGDWKTLVEKAQAEAKELGSTVKINIGVLRAHANYRLKKDVKYLGDMILSDTGVAKPIKTKK
jgi:hypothetical protein